MAHHEAQKLNDIILNPSKYDCPEWLLNRRKDVETGQDKHTLTADLAFAKESDIKRMKKTKSYKGMPRRRRFGYPNLPCLDSRVRNILAS